MGKMQRTKGAAFEREVVRDLINLGYDEARRNLEQVREGGGDINLPGFLLECKRYANIAVYKWLEQAKTAAKPEQTPVVVARADRKEPIVILYWNDFREMMDYAEVSTKPYNPLVSPDKAQGSI